MSYYDLNSILTLETDIFLLDEDFDESYVPRTVNFDPTHDLTTETE